jgi:hypothetical protein
LLKRVVVLPIRDEYAASAKPLNWKRWGGGEGDGDGEGEGDGDAAAGAGFIAGEGAGVGDDCACAAADPANISAINALLITSLFNIFP